MTTKAEYEKLNPMSQGYAQYMEGDWPGSELKNLKNPYPEGTPQCDQWIEGQMLACHDAQDSEE